MEKEEHPGKQKQLTNVNGIIENHGYRSVQNWSVGSHVDTGVWLKSLLVLTW